MTIHCLGVDGGARIFRFTGHQPEPNLPLTYFDRERFYRSIWPYITSPGGDIEAPAMHRTVDDTPLKPSPAEGPTSMRTIVFDHVKSSADIEECQSLPSHLY